MMLPPITLLLDLQRPPATRPVYDIPPFISYTPRHRHLRALVALLTSARSHAGIPLRRQPTRISVARDVENASPAPTTS